MHKRQNIRAEGELLILYRHGLLFLLSPKCAGTSVRRMAMGELGYALDELNYIQAKHVKYYSGFKKIMIVRNPYARMVSLYRDKTIKYEKQSRKRTKGKAFPPFGEIGVEKHSSFPCLMNQIARVSDEEAPTECHFRSQSIFYDVVNPDVIIKSEEIDKEWGKLNLPKLDICNASHSNGKNYMDFYDEITMEKVFERYKRDFKLFDYER